MLKPFKPQFHKMVKHPQTIDHFVRLVLRGITCPGGADFLSGTNVCKLMLHPSY